MGVTVWVLLTLAIAVAEIVFVRLQFDLFTSYTRRFTVLGIILLIPIFLGSIPFETLGLGPSDFSIRWVPIGVGLGGILVLLRESLIALVSTLGLEHHSLGDTVGSVELIRHPPDWLEFLAVMQPVVAVYEELLFRGVLIGLVVSEFNLSASLVVGISSVMFGVSHGTGMRIVTGLMGALLGVGFVFTGSLVAPIVAHYVSNGVLYLVHVQYDVDNIWTPVRTRLS